MIPFVGICVRPMQITGHSTGKPFLQYSHVHPKEKETRFAGWVRGRMGKLVFRAEVWWFGDFFLAWQLVGKEVPWGEPSKGFLWLPVACICLPNPSTQSYFESIP